MKYITLLLILFAMTGCEKERTASEKAELIFAVYMSDEQSAEIAEGIDFFEDLLMKYYNVDINNINYAYDYFLNDLSSTTSHDMFQNPAVKKKIEEFRRSGLLDSLYIITTVAGTRFYNINTTGLFYKSLKKQIKISTRMKEYIEGMKKFPETKLTTCAETLASTLIKKEYSNPVVKALVTFDIFFRIALTFE